jgi:HlyD family secretion protein
MEKQQSTESKTLKRGRKKWSWFLFAVLFILLLVVVWKFSFQQKTEPEAVTTAVVTEGNIEKIVAATGKVQANFEVEIKAKASGKILKMPYDVSDYVKQGELLVQLDPIDENRAVSQQAASLAGLESKQSQTQVNLSVAERTLTTDIAKAKADLAAASAKQRDAKVKAQRLQSLAQDRYISQEESETGQTTLAQANTDLQNAKTHLRELQTQQLALQSQAEEVEYASAQAQAQRVALASSRQRLAETKIYAPISGVVTARTGQIGQIVSSGISNVGGGTAIMMLADLTHIYVLASVDESDIGQVKEGQAVHITADAFPGEKFEGVVIRIAPKGLEESNVVTFEVKIEVKGANNHLLKPAMTTNVEIVTAHKDRVLKIPADAVRTGQSGRSFVMLAKQKPEDHAKRQWVTTGINNGTDVEILQGLSKGTVIVVSRGQARSRWRKDQAGQGQGRGGMNAGNRRGQMMMMRGLGGGRR